MTYRKDIEAAAAAMLARRTRAVALALAPSGALPAPAPIPPRFEDFNLGLDEINEDREPRSERESDERYFSRQRP